MGGFFHARKVQTMTVKMPGALWLPINQNYTPRKRSITTALILHIAVTEAASLSGWFNNPKAYASSHLYVRRDGTIEQYIDLDLISWANGAGNSRSVTVETQGMAGGAWTKEQVASLAAIARFVGDHYKVPMQVMGNSKRSTHGVGYHLLGVPANAAQKRRGVSQTGGELWSSSVGKICPGPSRVPQIPGIVNLAKGDIKPVAVKPKPKPPIKVSPNNPMSKLSKEKVERIQRILAGFKMYRGDIDGIPGPVTVEAVQYYQRNQLFGSLVPDGDWGNITEAHYAWVKLLQRNLNLWEGYNILVDGDYRKVTSDRVRNVMQRNEGGSYRGKVDAIPGPMFCAMLGIPTHP